MKRMALIVALVWLILPAPIYAQQPAPGTATYTLSPPKAAATGTKPIIISLTVLDPANNANTKTVQVQVPFLGPPPQPNIAPFNPATETAAQASQRKRDAIASAINGYIAAGLLPPAVTVSTSTGPSWEFKPTPSPRDPQGRFCCWVFMPTGGANGFGTVTINGLIAPPKTVADPTKEGGTGANWKPGVGSVPGKASYVPSMSGPGSTAAVATGLDPTGVQSVVAFGFFQTSLLTTCTPILPTDCPGVDIATISPTAGETDGQILSALALEFNSQFGPEGHTATYDLLSDTLGLNEPLTTDQTFFWANTDTGLDFSVTLAAVPQPSTIFLLGLGLAAGASLSLLGWTKGNKRNGTAG